ncbi:MAG: hypothetical protein FK730_14950 [Asgard group archaeon]|nr:hypothetical protein [Asgard group archaeon]
MAQVNSRGYILAIILSIVIIVPTMYFGIKFIRTDLKITNGNVEEFELGTGYIIASDYGASRFIGVFFIFLGMIFTFIALSSIFQMQSRNYHRFAY